MFPRVNLNCKSLMFAAQPFGKAVGVFGYCCYEWGQLGNLFLDLIFLAWKHLDLLCLTRKSQGEIFPCMLLMCAGWDLSWSRLLMQSFS